MLCKKRFHINVMSTVTISIISSLLTGGMIEQAQTQQIAPIVFQTGFEDGGLPANVTIHTVGNFTSAPAIKPSTHFGSTKAFGFGKTDCTADCWDDNTSTLRIQLPESVPIALISFDEAELDGNYGSTGYVMVDGQVVNDGTFERLPWNDGIADSEFRHHELTVNLVGRTIDFKVIDITSTSEMFIDNIEIIVYPQHPTNVIGSNFEDAQFPPNFSYNTRGTFTISPQICKPPLLNGRMGFGFGSSDCNSGAWWNYTTTLEIDLGSTQIVEFVRFSEAELGTNWGNQGFVMVDDHEIPHSVFGRLPSNDYETDFALRLHHIPVRLIGRKVVLKVWDITDCGMIIIDDIHIGVRPLSGETIFWEDFEDDVLEPQISTQTIGNYIDPPGVKPISSLSGFGAFGFGRSDCDAGCYEADQSSLTLFFPKGVDVSSLRFKAMELVGNWGSQGRMYINGHLWPSMDFARQPSNDLRPDAYRRNYDCLLNTRVHEIKWTVWDVSLSSEMFIDDIELVALQPGAVEGPSQQPSVIGILQNYPNPFNTSTTITFWLSETATVLLTIYNAQGQIVEQRNLGIKTVGRHQEIWDAEKCASGQYFCRLETPTTVKTTQMVLVR